MTDIIDEDPWENFPEVLPEHHWHDGWNGAAGGELREEPYEPYPHQWDQNLLWCRLRYAGYYNDWGLDRPPDKIPGWIYKRALPYVRMNDNLRRYG